MFLEERLLGVSIYALTVVLFFFLIRRIKANGLLLTVLVLLFGLMGYGYIPLSGSDLYRNFITMNYYGSLSSQALYDQLKESSTPLGGLYYYCLSSLSDEHFLPCITAIITYSLIFFLLYKTISNIEVSQKIIAVTVLFFLSRGLLMMTIANIRTMLALSVVALAIYFWHMRKLGTIKCFVIISVASLMHTICALVLVVFFFLVLLNKEINLYIRIISALVCIIGIAVFGGKYLILASEKGAAYVSSYQDSTGYFYIWEMLLSMMVISITLWLIYKFLAFNHCNMSSLKKQNANYWEFIKSVGLISIINILLFFIEFNVAFRLSWLISILDIALVPVLACIGNNKMKIYTYNILLICSVFMLLISCSRGDMCSLKFM